MPPKIQDLQGLWRRSLIAWPNGVDDTTEVRWLQGTEVYVDLRQPAGLPDFVGRRGIAHLSMADCRALAALSTPASCASRHPVCRIASAIVSIPRYRDAGSQPGIEPQTARASRDTG